MEGCFQTIARAYKSDKIINFIGVDILHLKADCIDGGIVIGVKRPVLFSSTVDKPPGQQLMQELRVKLYKKITKRVLSYIMFYLEDDDKKPVKFKGKTVSFTC